MSNLMLDVDQAGELKAAFRRAEWTNGLIKQLCESNLLIDLKKVLEGVAEIVVKSVLSVLKSVAIEAVAEKKTADCFTNKKRYAHRDADLDKLLPEVQAAQSAVKITAHQLARGAEFVEMVQGLFGTTETNIAALSRLAIEAGQVFTLTQIEVLIERQEAGEDAGLRIDGRGDNFFLVVNKERGVSVVRASRGNRMWYVYLDSLEDDSLWLAGSRFFSRNPLSF